MGFKTIGTKITVFVVVLLLGTTSLVAGLSYWRSKVALVSSSEDYCQEVVLKNGKFVEGKFNEFNGELLALKAAILSTFNVDLASMSGEIYFYQFASQNTSFVGRLAEQIDEVRDIYIVFNPEVFPDLTSVQKVWFTKKDGVLQPVMDQNFTLEDLKNPSDEKTKWFRSAIGSDNPVWSEVYVDENGEKRIDYDMAVEMNGKKVAVIGMSLDFSFIDDALKSRKVLDTGYVYMIDDDGRFLSHPTLTIDGPVMADVDQGEIAPMYRTMMENKRGINTIFFGGTDRLVAFDTLSNGLVVVASAPVSEALANLKGLASAVGISSLVILVLAVTLTILLSRSITAPLKRMLGVAKRIEDGDLTFRREDIIIKGRDEVVQLAHAMAGMAESMRGTIKNVVDQTEATTQRSESMSSMIQQVTSSMEEVNTSLERMLTIAEGNSAALQESNASVEEVASGAQQSAQDASSGAEASEKGISETENAVKKVLHTIDRMEKAGDQSSRSIDNIRELAEAVESISGFVATITGIADQTNLLALNAAIEAARAGDAGRGFAVVAEEVRKLAEESGASAKEIGDLIDGLQETSKRSISATENTGSILSEAVKEAKDAEEQLQKAMSQMKNVNEAIQNLAAVAEEQAASSEEMTSAIQSVTDSTMESVESMNSIQDATERTTKAAERVAEEAESLAESMEDLQSMVGKFTVERNGGLRPVES
jgi:methyl-accepting chemotaxis protein